VFTILVIVAVQKILVQKILVQKILVQIVLSIFQENMHYSKYMMYESIDYTSQK